MNFFFAVKDFFVNLNFKKGLKINFRIITKNHAADSKIGSIRKIDFWADGTHESHPTAWELTLMKIFVNGFRTIFII